MISCRRDVTLDLINGLYIGRVSFDFERRELGLGSPFDVKCAVYAPTVDSLERVCVLYHEATRLSGMNKSVTVGVQSNWVVSYPFPCGDREVEAAVKVVIEDVRRTMVTESRTKVLNSCVVRQLDTRMRRGRTSVDSFVTIYARVLYINNYHLAGTCVCGQTSSESGRYRGGRVPLARQDLTVVDDRRRTAGGRGLLGQRPMPRAFRHRLHPLPRHSRVVSLLRRATAQVSIR